jgi:serine/threonine protein kinase
MAAVPEATRRGQRVGRYELIRRLAVGGMAEIYLARVPGVGIEGFEKLIVLKKILPQHALDPELLRMFLDEARLTATLTHPHITEVYDVGTTGDTPFFTMEYVHGANLRQVMKVANGSDPKPLPLEHAVGIVAAAASGLHYAHDKLGPGGEPLHIVHRDVSPSNVLVSYDGAVKVSDFGIAKWTFQRTQTQEGALKGKFAYMSPEQCRGQPLDRRSDVFALGTILYELTTGQPPFRADSDYAILNAIVAGTVPRPHWPPGERDYPPELETIVLRALARDPADRYPTAQALQVDLEAFARAERLEVSTVALGSYMQALFADELAAWREAQRAGKSLGEHLAESEAAPSSFPTMRTATDVFGSTRQASRRRRRRRVIAVAALLGLTLVGGVMAAGTRARRATLAPVASGAPAPAPATAPAAPPPREKPVATASLGSTANGDGNNVEAHSPPPPTLPAARPSGKRGRARPAGAAAPTNPERSIESKLGAWDPDSPVPP